jgi:hypothetical protein
MEKDDIKSAGTTHAEVVNTPNFCMKSLKGRESIGSPRSYVLWRLGTVRNIEMQLLLLFRYR